MYNCISFNGHPVVVAENGIDTERKLINFINKGKMYGNNGYFPVAVTKTLYGLMVQELRGV